MTKISQCIIVKNEELNIEKALTWGKNLVFEQIVVDTGSTDNTVDIAQKMGAKVYHFDWIDDFSAAKNYALTKAKGDWIAFLDADEYFAKDDIPILKELIENLDTKQILRGNGIEYTDIICCPLINLKGSGKLPIVGRQTRLFRNSENLRFVNKIHENITDITGRTPIIAEIENKIPIYHTGYIQDDTNLFLYKSNRNVNLIKQYIKKFPNEPQWYQYAAESLSLGNYYHEAYKNALKAARLFKKNHDFLNTRKSYLLAIKCLYYTKQHKENITPILQLYNEIIDNDNLYYGYDIVIGYAMIERTDYIQGIFYLEQALEKNIHHQFDYEVELNLKDIYHYLMVANISINNKPNAVHYATLSLRIDKYQKQPAQLLLTLLEQDNTAIEDTLKLLTGLYDIKDKRDKLFLLQISQLLEMHDLEQFFI